MIWGAWHVEANSMTDIPHAPRRHTTSRTRRRDACGSSGEAEAGRHGAGHVYFAGVKRIFPSAPRSSPSDTIRLYILPDTTTQWLRRDSFCIKSILYKEHHPVPSYHTNPSYPSSTSCQTSALSLPRVLDSLTSAPSAWPSPYLCQAPSTSSSARW